MMDESLLKTLDADAEVRRIGRSAVFRRIAAEYLNRREREEIAEGYNRAYGKESDGLGAEFNGWEDEAVWPQE